MTMQELIEIKKRGEALSLEQIRYIVNGYTDGSIPDYQMSAFLMAVCFKGMDFEETAALTDAMVLSGGTVDLSRFGARTADKHSTGGVGDKTTLVVAPVVSSLGVVVAKMSGRGLGHTGGTIDKLESIQGFRTALSENEFLAQVEKTGVAVVGQTSDLVPADKKMYALRDVTGTVDSIPLIASSIMSKKLCAGAKNIVLDIKTGSGAFMRREEDAVTLAQTMVDIGTRRGRNMAALITDMEAPLGRAVGNSLEVIEAVEVLKGRGDPVLYDVCIALAAQMLSLVFEWDTAYARHRAEEEIRSGKAFLQMKRWVSAQGGNAAWLDDTALFPKAPVLCGFKASADGYILAVDARSVGEAASALGAGRVTKDGVIDLSAGVTLEKTVGDYVKKGDTLALLHTADEARLENAAKNLEQAFVFGAQKAPARPHIRKTII